ncbi:MAG: DUF559 domain-containing protein [Fimbriimonadaceae bacterium]
MRRRIDPILKARAREMRSNMTKPELFFWNKVRSWASQGVQIRRQHVIEPYIVDFSHIPSKTIIEIDGRSHRDQDAPDTRRQKYLEELGWRVLRIDNDELIRDSDKIAQSVFQYLVDRGVIFTSNWENSANHPSLSGEGQGWGETNQLNTLLNHPALQQIAKNTKHTPYENNLYIVGGAVRDALLNREPKHDLDIVTELDAQTFAKSLDKKAQIYPRFGTAMIRIAKTNIELVTARKESYHPTSRKPNTQPATLLEDAHRRDFTVNTLLLNIHTGELKDPLETAIKDLQSQTLRTPLDPSQTFHDDPLRMLRAVRFKYQLGFEFHPLLKAALPRESNRLSIISQERIRDEFTKILLGPNPEMALQELLDFNLLHTWAPELEAMVGVEQGKWHYADVWTHTLHVVKIASQQSADHPSLSGEGHHWDKKTKTDAQHKSAGHPSLIGEGQGWGEPFESNTPKESTSHPSPSGEAQAWGDNFNLVLLLAALLHDIAKPLTRTIDEKGDTRFFNHENIGAELAHTLCLRWRYSQETARDVRLLVKNHMRLSGIKTLSTPATRRIIRDLGSQLNNWITLIDADANALKTGVRKLDLSDLIAKLAEVKTSQPKSNWNSPLTGDQIMEITGLPPSPAIGEIKAELENLVIEGHIPPDDLEKAKDALQNILRNRL